MGTELNAFGGSAAAGARVRAALAIGRPSGRGLRRVREEGVESSAAPEAAHLVVALRLSLRNPDAGETSPASPCHHQHPAEDAQVHAGNNTFPAWVWITEPEHT